MITTMFIVTALFLLGFFLLFGLAQPDQSRRLVKPPQTVADFLTSDIPLCAELDQVTREPDSAGLIMNNAAARLRMVHGPVYLRGPSDS